MLWYSLAAAHKSSPFGGAGIEQSEMTERVRVLSNLPCEMRLTRSAELVGAKPLHLLTQTALPLKSPTGAFIATLRSANVVASDAKL